MKNWFRKAKYPPLIEECIKQFNVDTSKVCFAYGETIYSSSELSPDLMVHEGVHQRRQIEMGVEKWWRKYLDDKRFRAEEEVMAYRAQYDFLKMMVKDRNLLYRYLHKISSDLSSPVYGSIISYSNAKKLIKC